MMSALFSRCLILVLGTLYPAYRSYKALKNKDLREHVKWMMYWIVFALFSTLETFLDVFVSWFPFYYEIKILFILWVLSPATRGSSILYKKVVHPMLNSREQEIDELIEKTKINGYSAFLQIFTSGFNYASNLFMNSAMRGQSLLGSQLQKSLSVTGGSYEQKSKSNVKNSKSNDGFFSQQQDMEENESSDFEHEPKIIQRKQTNQSRPQKKNSYDLLDDGILIEELPKSALPKSTTKRRTNKQAPNIDQNSTNYRTNEASHYGTITRGKKNRPQLSNSNDSDQ